MEGGSGRGGGGAKRRGKDEITRHNGPEQFVERRVKLMKKAADLATNCGVDVAVICSGVDGEGETVYWPSKEKVKTVADQYLALPETKRARHTEDYEVYVAGQLKRAGIALDMVRKRGVALKLGSWGHHLDGKTEEELRYLLLFIESSLVVARGRIEELETRHGGEADQAGLRLALGHADEAMGENSVMGAGDEHDMQWPSKDTLDLLGQFLASDSDEENSTPLDAAAPMDVEEPVAEGDVAATDVSAQPSGDAAADDDAAAAAAAAAADAEWMQDLVQSLKEKPEPSNAAPPSGNAGAPYNAGIEYIDLGGGFVMEKDAYDYIRFDLGMPPPVIEPVSPDYDYFDEPLQLWSWDESTFAQPPPPPPPPPM